MNGAGQVPICEICNLRRGILIKSLPNASLSVAACRPCHEAGAVPMWVAVRQTVEMGGMEDAPPWWEYVVHDTLDHLNVTPAEFARLVREASMAEAP